MSKNSPISSDGYLSGFLLLMMIAFKTTQCGTVCRHVVRIFKEKLIIELPQKKILIVFCINL